MIFAPIMTYQGNNNKTEKTKVANSKIRLFNLNFFFNEDKQHLKLERAFLIFRLLSLLLGAVNTSAVETVPELIKVREPKWNVPLTLYIALDVIANLVSGLLNSSW